MKPSSFGIRDFCGHGGGVILLMAVIFWGESSLVLGQNQPVLVRRYPVDGYQASLMLLSEGRLSEAQHGFETAFRISRQAGDDHGIDSVPILMRVGQSLCLQGDLAEGLRQVELSLLLAKRCRRWIDFMQNQPVSMRAMSSESRGIHWYNSQRTTELAVYPDSWPVAIGIGTLMVETIQGEATPVVEVIRLDALEVYLAQAVGLRLRYQILGSMATDMPMSREILAAFPAPRRDFPEVLLRCHNICQALAMIAVGESKEAARLIQSNLEVQGEWDHPLTGVGLLALADIAMMSDDRATAVRMIAEATLVFARLGQYDWLAEAVKEYASVSAVRRQPNSMELLSGIANWVRSRSYLAFATASASLSSLAAELENFSTMETNANQALRKGAKAVGPIPCVQAATRYAQARSLIKQGRIEQGRTALELPLQWGQGVDLPGPLSRYLLRWDWLQSELEAGRISNAIAAKAYAQLIDGPSEIDWLYRPWECLAAATGNTRPHALRWYQMVARQGNSEATVLAIDRLQRSQCRFFLSLGGRELDLRTLFHSPRLNVSDELRPKLMGLRKQFPAIDQAAVSIKRQIDSAAKIKSIDAKDWTAEEKNTWSQLAAQCDMQEQRILDASTGPTSIPPIFPHPLSIAEMKKKLLSDDSGDRRAILGFLVTPSNIYGYWLGPDHLQTWAVERSILAHEKFGQLREAIGIGEAPGKIMASIKKPTWQPIAKELEGLLIPRDIQQRLSAIKSLTVIPDGWLWYVPFEVFPDLLVPDAPPWIARRALSYAPTIGNALQDKMDGIASGRTLGITRSGFFVPEKELDSALTKELLSSVDGSQSIDIAAKVHPSRWSRLQFDRVWVAANTSLEGVSPFAMMAYDAGGNTSLRQWMQLPMTAPSVMILLGNEIPAMNRMNGDGTELFRLACCLAATGNHATLVNRWSPRGESTQLLTKDFLASADELPAAQAWRRSVLSLWETPLRYPTEPILGSLKKEFFEEEFSGRHPIFWAGTMVLGNTQSAESP